MEIRQLVTFLAVIEQQSFSKAADVLGYTQAAVTIQIQQLEKEFHTRFFDRVGRHPTLTPPGEQFAQYAREIVRQDELAHKRVSNAVSRGYSLRIGTQDSLLRVKMPQLIQYFYIHLPETSISITTGTPQQLLEMLDHNQLDIVYILDYPVSSPNWVKVLEAETPIVFVASAQSYLAKANDISMKELAAQRLFLTERDTSYRQALDHIFLSKQLELRPFLETADISLITRLIQSNQGVSFLPRMAVEKHVRDGKLALLNVSDVKLDMYIQLLYHKNKWVNEEMQTAVRLLRTETLR